MRLVYKLSRDSQLTALRQSTGLSDEPVSTGKFITTRAYMCVTVLT